MKMSRVFYFIQLPRVIKIDKKKNKQMGPN